MEGRLGGECLRLRDDLLQLLAQLEAYIDFPEEGIEPEVGKVMLLAIESVIGKVARLAGTAQQGKYLREGVRTVIAGRPNVGKSSLVNYLLGFDRVIVSEVAGTTRDTVEELVDLRGIPLRIVDTAGIHETTDCVESQGIERSWAQLEQADLVLEVFDGTATRVDGLADERLRGRHHIKVLNKCDLPLDQSWEAGGAVIGVQSGWHKISCVSGLGFDELIEAIQKELTLDEVAMMGSEVVAINSRHQQSLKHVRESLEIARDQLENNEEPEFVAVNLRIGLDALGEVVGKVDTEDVLGEIFSSFCIGK